MQDFAPTHPARVPRVGLTSLVVGLLMLLPACAHTPAPSPNPGSAASTPASSPSSSGQSPIGSESPVPAESNPPGDIPDNTVFVAYRSAAGRFVLKVPEGWARRSSPSGVKFVSNLNSIAAVWMNLSSAPTVTSTKATTIPSLRSSSLAFRLQSVRSVTLPGGPAIETIYLINSKPNPITGKQYRMVIERFELFRAGHGVVLNLSSAVGSDNVDPWRTVSESFRWK